MYRDVNFESAVNFARDIVRIPSISGDEGAVAERIMSEFKLLRFDETWTDEIGNIFARLKGQGNGPAILLSCHLDVVDAGDKSEWEYPPFDGIIADNYLHGRGAVDCKGPLALQTYAVASLRESRPPGDVYVVHTVLEECGSWGMAHAMEQLSDRIAAVVLGEATQGDICIGHRGRIELMITIRGTSAHASAPEKAENATLLLPLVLAAIQKFAAQLPSHNVLPRSTLAPTVIETWPKSRNMVPEEVRVLVDWRTLPLGREHSSVEGFQSFLLKEMRHALAEMPNIQITVEETLAKQRAYTGWERTLPISTCGFLMSHSHSVVGAAEQAVWEATGCTPGVRPWTFGTDGGYPCGRYGIPTIGYAPGAEGYSHTNRERLDLESARTVYHAYPALIRKIQKIQDEDAMLESYAAVARDHLFMKRLKVQ